MLKKSQHLIDIVLMAMINKREINKKVKVLELDGQHMKKIILLIGKIFIRHFKLKKILLLNIKVY